ncbi:MAG: tetratricopeptide repeat protein, partial [Gammaproteobacteria bacterium]|nr:tetratricopeptide repeat protein [Gammaproteobacteria bacterium]
LAGVEGLAQVIAKLLVKEPKARYQRAAEVLIDLNATLGEAEPVESEAIRESYLQAATFVGRVAEMGQLTAALGQVQAGSGAVWLIGGESGVGKTRLVDELRIQAMIKGIAVLRGQAVEGGGLPFQVWREPSRRLLLLQEVSDLQARVLKDIVSDIERLLDREIPDAPPVTGAAYQQRLIGSIVDLFRDLSIPTLLILEDLQWVGESLTVLQHLQRVIEQVPYLLIVGSYRDDERPTLANDLPGAQTLHLARLNEAEVAQLSRAMLGEAGQNPQMTGLLTSETEGNTFFIVEVMRALAEESGSLDAIGKMTLPTDVFTQGMQHILQRRIQQVPAAAQALLRLAAVVGRQLDEQLLALWADTSQLEEWLQTCADEAILSIRDQTWFFAHDKLRETILSDLQDAEHPRLHRQVAEAIEQVYPDDASYDEVLLEHWHQARDLDKEIHYLNPVAEHLIQITADYARAHILLERGLQTLPATDVRSAALLNKLAASHTKQGHYAEAEAAAQTAHTLAQQVKDQLCIASSLNNLGVVAKIQGNYVQAQDYLQQGLSIYRDIGDQWGIGDNLNNLGTVARRQGDYAQAQEYYQQSLSIYRDVDHRLGIAMILNNLGNIAADQGDYGQTRNYHQQSLSIKRDIGHQWGIVNSLNTLGFVYLRIQRGLTQATFHEALTIAYSIQAIPLLLMALAGSIWLYLQGDNPIRAGELCGLIQHHPAYDSDVQKRLNELRPLLQDALSATDLEAALARGKTLDLDTVVAELLVEFAEDNS